MTRQSESPSDDRRQPEAEVPVVAANGAVRLSGSVWLPALAPPRGLVLMHPGSGPSDRNNDVLFPPIRAALLTTGVAVCSFDKRGVGGSSGDWREGGIEQQADDLAHGLQAARHVVPDGPVGLFGHSQGGWVVLEATRHVAPKFVITNSGPSVSPFRQELYSTRNRLRDAGWDAAAVDSGVALFSELMTLALDSVPFEHAQRAIAGSGRKDELTALAEAGVFVPDSVAMWSHASSLLGYDPAPVLADFAVPLLALFGALDSVVPVDECVARLRQLVRPDLLQVDVVDGSDHRVQLDGSAEFGPGYLATLTAFVAAHLR